MSFLAKTSFPDMYPCSRWWGTEGSSGSTQTHKQQKQNKWTTGARPLDSIRLEAGHRLLFLGSFTLLTIIENLKGFSLCGLYLSIFTILEIEKSWRDSFKIINQLYVYINYIFYKNISPRQAVYWKEWHSFTIFANFFNILLIEDILTSASAFSLLGYHT